MTVERHPHPFERERLARMRGFWQEDRPSDVEVERARTRWLSRARVAPSPGGPRILLVAAVVFGAAGALAATGAVTWPEMSDDRPVVQPSVSAQPAAEPRAAARGPRALAVVRVAAPPATLVVPESVAPAKRTLVPASEPDSGSAPRSGPPTDARFASPSYRAPVPAPSVGLPERAEPSGAWQRAARALREGDQERAAHALRELSSSSDPYTRETARLAKAQLDAAAGRWELALPVLRRLATTGSTPLLKRRAAEVLAQAPHPQ